MLKVMKAKQTRAGWSASRTKNLSQVGMWKNFPQAEKFLLLKILSAQVTISRTSWPWSFIRAGCVTVYLASLFLLLRITGLLPSPNTLRWCGSFALDDGPTKLLKGWNVFSGWLVAVATLLSSPKGKKTPCANIFFRIFLRPHSICTSVPWLCECCHA